MNKLSFILSAGAAEYAAYISVEGKNLPPRQRVSYIWH